MEFSARSILFYLYFHYLAVCSISASPHSMLHNYHSNAHHESHWNNMLHLLLTHYHGYVHTDEQTHEPPHVPSTIAPVALTHELLTQRLTSQHLPSTEKPVHEGFIEFPPKLELSRRQEYSEWWREFQASAESCGQSRVQPLNPKFRIIGGHITTVDAYPWMVSLYSNLILQPWCAGTLIASQWVLTAAHCFRGPFSFPDYWTLHFGKNNASGFAEYSDEQVRSIADVFVHPDFNEHAETFAFDNDIALIRLDKPVSFNRHTSPLCIVRSADQITDDVRDDITCTITGYGLTSTSDVSRELNVLHEAMVPLLSKVKCQETDGYTEKVTDNMVCAGQQEGGVDTCQGDSGGPLQCKLGGRWYHVGITSWGGRDYEGCAGPNEPGVYTDVSRYTGWIYSTMFLEESGDQGIE